MIYYRVSRNIEASLIDFIKQELVEEDWKNIAVEKSFHRANMAFNQDKDAAVICVRASTTARNKVEIGSDSIKREQLILIDVFARNDGQKEDLVDFLCDILKSGFTYSQYRIEDDHSVTAQPNGRVRVLNIDDTPVNLNNDKSSLDTQDRYRHLITINVSTGKVEA